jgi:hypothetical protein
MDEREQLQVAVKAVYAAVVAAEVVAELAGDEDLVADLGHVKVYVEWVLSDLVV